jgi:D-3-phosphoglycerate dehydrogenase / 2-oxoglutarate reductase
MPHVLVAGRIHGAAVELLKAAPGMTCDFVDEVSFESYVPLVSKADAILIRTQAMPATVIDQAPHLKIVSRHGVGYDAIDAEALSKRGIPLAIVGDVNSRAVAEHTLMLMLVAARRTVAHHNASRTGNWGIRNRFEGSELDEKTLLLCGFGRIGRRVAALAQAFGMTVMAYDPFVSADAIQAAGVRPATDLEAALPETDYISLHIPALPKGVVIGEKELAKLKPSAIIINSARGGLIDEMALDSALKAGRLAGAALDVFAQEPPPADHPLLHNERVTISPHSAGLTQECAKRMGIAAVQNILDFFAGRLDRKLVVNQEKTR